MKRCQEIIKLFASKNVLIAIFLIFFVMIYPPFTPTVFITEYRIVRILIEGLILLWLTFSLISFGAEFYLYLLIFLCLYLFNFIINTDDIDKVISHLNKLTLLFYLPIILSRNNKLLNVLRKTWIRFWIYCSVIGVVGSVLFVSKLIKFNYIEEKMCYYTLPFLGSYILKNIGMHSVPRYLGFLVEPIYLGFFCGFNMIVAKKIIFNKSKYKWFVLFNLIAGLLSISYIFLIFLVFFFLLKLKTVIRLISNKIVVALGFPISVITITLNFNNIEKLLPYSSWADRIGRYKAALIFLHESPVVALAFGSGKIFFQNTIDSGAACGFLDVLASRGIFILIVWTWFLYLNARHVSGLFAYIMFYSLVLDYWHFPLFIFGLSIIASLDSSKINVQSECV